MTSLNPKKVVSEELIESSLQFPDSQLIHPRQVWAANRFWMETNNVHTKRYGGRSSWQWSMISLMGNSLEQVLRMTGFFEKGVRNAETIVLREIPLSFPDLPPAFDGFTILHLSDLHLDGMPGSVPRILEKLPDQEVDLCVLTGDFRAHLDGPFSEAIDDLRPLIEGIRSRHGIFGVLGNHDSCQMLHPLEKLGIRMLINENFRLHQGGQQIRLVGTDDVHFYYTDQAVHALEQGQNDFSIALIHSPELYDVAAEMGVDLYLCGHTHGGQICWPGGIPLIKHLNKGKAYFRGLWSYQNMQGFTHSGVGTSRMPVRFNTQAEVVLFTLQKRSKK
ncbi:MAG: metallophosphoesterase [SAR324 cluster bacterium]|nr:metallophosphoesterase [SAR324 cluster bacterium]